MRRLVFSLAAAIAVAAPLAAPAPALADPRDRWEERREHRWDRRSDDRRWDHRRWDRHDDDRDDRRDRRRGRGWDRSRHNGYYYQDRWYYGPPPTVIYADPYYRPGYSAWRRGAYLPSYYRGYVIEDYGRYRLRQPPRGYAWYRVGDDYLLAAIATGIIFEIIDD